MLLPSSTVLSLAGTGAGVPVSFSDELGHLETRFSSRPRKVFSRSCIKGIPLQQNTINGLNSKNRNSLSSFAFGKKAEDSFFSMVKWCKVPLSAEEFVFDFHCARFPKASGSYVSRAELVYDPMGWGHTYIVLGGNTHLFVTAFGKDVNGDTDEMYDELINNYGKVVFSRKDKKPASAEIDDDAESLSFAVELATVASEVKAGDIKVLFVKPLVYWTRFFIIATAFSRPQIDAIGSRIRDRAEKKYGKIPTGDTKPNSWTLLDFGDVVVHIFLPSQRAFYNLEEFYGNATQVELPFENQPPPYRI